MNLPSSTLDLRRLRTKIRQCARAGVFLPGSDPKGFIRILDAELKERSLSQHTQQRIKGPVVSVQKMRDHWKHASQSPQGATPEQL